jgi:hypothetical protein
MSITAALRTDEWQRAVGACAHEITGAEHLAPPLRIERIGNEPFGRARRIVVIAARESGAADQELARNSRADRAEHLIDNEAGGICDRAADGNGPVGTIDTRCSRPYRRLGRAVEIPERSDAREDFRGKRRRQRLSAAQRGETIASLPADVEQHLPGRRRGLHRGHIPAFDTGGQESAVARTRLVRNDDTRADRQRQQQLERGDVERIRRDGKQNVVGGQPQLRPHRGQEIRERAALNFNAERPARGARGMDDVGEVVRFGGGESDGFRRDVGRLDEQERRVAGKVLRRAGIRDDNGGFRIRDDGREALRGIGRIERDVGGCGPQGRQHGDRQVPRARQADPHPRAATDPLPRHDARQALDPPDQSAIAEIARGIRHRDGVGAGGGGSGQRRQHVRPVGERGPDDQLRFASPVPEIRDLARWRGHDLMQDRLVVVDQARDGAILPEVAAIVDYAEDLIVELLDRERHVEGRTIARDRNRFDRVLAVLDRETRYVQERRHQPARIGGVEALHAKHDLEDGGATRLSRRSDVANNHREGIILVLERGANGCIDLGNQLLKRILAAQTRSDRQGVHEVADHALEFRSRAPAHRRADDDIGRSAVAMQQHVEGRQQHREQRRSFRPCQTLQLLDDRALHDEVARRARTERAEGSRVVGGERQ